MARKTVYFHIGIGKTGTKTAQNFFWRNRKELLARHGLLYPNTGVEYWAHHPLAELNVDIPGPKAQKLYGQLVKQIAKSKCERVLISSENYCYVPESYVRYIKEQFADFDVKVIFNARQQVPLVQSAYKTWLKLNSAFVTSLTDYAREYQNAFNFNNRVAPWANVFGKDSVSSFLYGSSSHPRDPVELILGHIIADYKTPEKLQNLNPSFVAELSGLVQEINRLSISQEDREKLMHEVHVASEKLKPLSENEPFSRDERAVLVERYVAANEVFSKQYLSSDEARELTSFSSR